MIFSWLTSSQTNSQPYHDKDYKQTKQTLNDNDQHLVTILKEDDWIQITKSHHSDAARDDDNDGDDDNDEYDQQVPKNSSPDSSQKKKKKKQAEGEEEGEDHQAPIEQKKTLPMPKKISRQQRRYQARLAQQAQKKQVKVPGEEQLKAALTMNKSRQQHLIEKFIQPSTSSCLPTRAAITAVD